MAVSKVVIQGEWAVLFRPTFRRGLVQAHNRLWHYDSVERLNAIKKAQREVTWKVAVFPIPEPVWAPQTDDLQTYGIVADGKPTSFYVVHRPTEHTVQLMPPVDSKVEMYLQCTQKYHTSPEQVLGPTAVKIKVQSIFEQCKIFYSKAKQYANRRQKEYLNAARKNASSGVYDDNGKAEPVTDEELLEDFDFTHILETSYESDLKKFLFQYVGNGNITESVCKKHPKTTTDELRMFLAGDAAKQLYPGTNDADFKTIITAFVTAQKDVPVENVVPDIGIPFHGRRVAQPRGLPSRDVHFIIHRPKQPLWPAVLQQPPIIVEFPEAKFDGQAREFFKKVVPKQPTITALIITMETNTTSREAADAVRDCNGFGKNSPEAAFYEHIIRFASFPKDHLRDFTACYPGIHDMIQSGSFSPEFTERLRKLKHTRSGNVIVTGTAGTGKTEEAMQIVFAALKGGYEAHAGWNSGVTEPTPAPRVAKLQFTLPIDLEVEIDDALNTPFQPSPTEASNPLRNSPPKEDGPKLSWSDFSGQTVTSRLQSEVVASSAHWTAAQNNQADDAMRRLAAKPFNLNVLRIYPIAQEMDNAFRLEPLPLQQYPIPKDSPDVLQTILNTCNDGLRVRYQRGNPASNPNSLSNRVKAMLNMNPELWPIAERGRQLRAKDTLQWQIIKRDAKAEMCRIMESVIMDADVVISTAVVAAQIANFFPNWLPMLKVVDDAGCLPEAHALIPNSKWFKIPCLFIGDPNQVPPVDPTHKAVIKANIAYTNKPASESYFSPFFDQERISLLKRAEKMNALDYTLDLNHRSFGTVSEFVSSYMAPGKMNIANREGNKYSAQTLAWCKKICPSTQTTHLMVGVDGTENHVGTSFVNHDEAKCAVNLALFIIKDLKLPRYDDIVNRAATIRCGQVLILSPYKQQVYAIQAIINSINRSELALGLIEVCTADNSAGLQAEVSIVSFVRTRRPGFIGEFRRVFTLLSRSHFGLFTLANLDLVKGQSGWLRKEWEYHEATGSIIELTMAHNKSCGLCLQCGHTSKECPSKSELKCSICFSQRKGHLRFCRHSLRNCPEVMMKSSTTPVASEVFEDNQPTDGLVRNPFELVEGKQKEKKSKIYREKVKTFA
ncbi:hypothetical protein QQS21_011260, partial [Conoideocrella luteorostrata]